MFPMTVIKQSARAQSSSGGKEYHLVLVTTSDEKALLIQRWGKAGKWGTLDVSTGTKTQIQRVYNAKFREKWDGQYRDHFKDERKEVHDETELRAFLGAQYWAQIGASNLKFLLPTTDTSDVRDPDNPEWIPDGKGGFKKKEREVKTIPDPVLTVEDQVNANPNWGLF